MSDQIIITSYNTQWPEMFQTLGRDLRDSLGELALRIDHIGSTAIEGMEAKPIIDIQISVDSFDCLEELKESLGKLGYIYRFDNPDKTKRYFRESPGGKRTHIHVRKYGSWSEQIALLFRDYMRNHPEDCREYAKIKYQLAEAYSNQRNRYVEGKSPFIWGIMQKADQWSQEVGWEPMESDA